MKVCVNVLCKVECKSINHSMGARRELSPVRVGCGVQSITSINTAHKNGLLGSLWTLALKTVREQRR